MFLICGDFHGYSVGRYFDVNVKQWKVQIRPNNMLYWKDIGIINGRDLPADSETLDGRAINRAAEYLHAMGKLND